MTRILILESETPEVLAEYGNSLAIAYGEALQQIDADIGFRVASPYRGKFGSGHLDGIDAVVFPGSRVHWSTDDDLARPLRAAMQRVFDAGIPVFGSCNGLQCAAVVLGGRVAWSADLEVGLAQNVELTPAGREHPMMRGRQSRFAVPAMHRDQVTELPRDAVRLAGNAHSSCQAFAYECQGVSFWGVQYHPEISAADVGRGIQLQADKYGEFRYLVDDLLQAESDEAAAARIGSSRRELSAPLRDTELRNWLSQVADRQRSQRKAG